MRLSRLLLTLSILAFLIVLLPSAHASSQETLRPNAVGDLTQLVPSAAPNWECVNEAVANGDTDYVKNDVANSYRKDLYNIPDTAIPIGSTINSVTVYWTAKKVAVPTTRAISGYSYIKTEATEYQGSATTLTTSYVEYNTAYTLNPKTGLAWTLAELNALQIGVYLGNYELDDTHFAYGRCTQVYVIIDYTVVSGAWNTVSTWSNFLVTRSWQTSGIWSEFLGARTWQNVVTWSNYLISRTWQNIASWSIILLTLGWHTVNTWSILLLGEDPTTIIVILFLFSVVAFTGIGLYRKRKKN